MRSMGKKVIVCINSKRKRCHRSEKERAGSHLGCQRMRRGKRLKKKREAGNTGLQSIFSWVLSWQPHWCRGCNCSPSHPLKMSYPHYSLLAPSPSSSCPQKRRLPSAKCGLNYSEGRGYVKNGKTCYVLVSWCNS